MCRARQSLPLVEKAGNGHLELSDTIILEHLCVVFAGDGIESSHKVSYILFNFISSNFLLLFLLLERPQTTNETR